MTIISIVDCDEDLLSDFSCGDENLDRFVRLYAKQNDKRNLGKTFVLIDENAVIGFYTLSSAQLNFNELTERERRRLPQYPIPCIRIARLAVCEKFQRQGYGAMLLKDAFLRILNVSQYTGVYFVIVDAKEVAKTYYEGYGFVPVEQGSSQMVLKVKIIEKAYKGSII